MRNLFNTIVTITCIILIASISYIFFCTCVLYKRTKLYKKYLCKNSEFCLMSKFNLIIPDTILYSCFKLYSGNIGTYKSIKFKSSKYISTSQILKHSPNIINYYQSLTPFFNQITNLNLHITPLDNNLSCGLLIYEKKGDFIDWHYDVNTYNGRFFTVLLPIYNNSNCCTFQYKYDETVYTAEFNIEQGIIFEGEHLYHRCTTLCDNELRIVLSLTYCTDVSTNFFKQTLNSLKNLGF